MRVNTEMQNWQSMKCGSKLVSVTKCKGIHTCEEIDCTPFYAAKVRSDLIKRLEVQKHKKPNEIYKEYVRNFFLEVAVSSCVVRLHNYFCVK